MDQARRDRFYGAYRRLSKLGLCDGPGGAEFKRVRAEWEECDFPEPLDDFIYQRANASSSEIDNLEKTLTSMRCKMSPETRRYLESQVRSLISECEDREDALQYIGDVMEDVGCSWQEAVAELDRQIAESQ